MGLVEQPANQNETLYQTHRVLCLVEESILNFEWLR
jgi:hypothetical protein